MSPHSTRLRHTETLLAARQRGRVHHAAGGRGEGGMMSQGEEVWLRGGVGTASRMMMTGRGVCDMLATDAFQK
jgi:hypothetical protein